MDRIHDILCPRRLGITGAFAGSLLLALAFAPNSALADDITYHCDDAGDPWRAWFEHEDADVCRRAIDELDAAHPISPRFVPARDSQLETTPDACLAVGFPNQMRVAGGVGPAHAAQCEVLAACAGPLDEFARRQRATPTCPLPRLGASAALEFTDLFAPLAAHAGLAARHLETDVGAWVAELAVPAAASIAEPSIMDVIYQIPIANLAVHTTLVVRFGPPPTVPELEALDVRLALGAAVVRWTADVLVRELQSIYETSMSGKLAKVETGYTERVAGPVAVPCFSDPVATADVVWTTWDSAACRDALLGEAGLALALLHLEISELVKRFANARGQQTEIALARALVAGEILHRETGARPTDIESLQARTGADLTDPLTGTALILTVEDGEDQTRWCVGRPTAHEDLIHTTSQSHCITSTSPVGRPTESERSGSE